MNSRLSMVETDRALEAKIISDISGQKIESDLIDLAKIGGELKEPTPEMPRRYGTNRLALSEEDQKAREEYIRPRMEEAGMDVFTHPLADIGILKGSDQSLSPIVIMSHTDTVPNGDMYDGTTGVIGAINFVEALKENDFEPERDIIVVSLTGEESSRFNFALFGSRSLFHGLTEEELDAKDSDGNRIRDLLSAEDLDIVRQPLFGNESKYKLPNAVIELHVEQFDELASNGLDIGIINSIAAPVRYTVEVGNYGAAREKVTPLNSHHFQITVEGKADHSGATPMDQGKRADALVETAKLIQKIDSLAKQNGVELNVSDIDLSDGQAINKIPGVAVTRARLSADTQDRLEEFLDEFSPLINGHKELIEATEKRFGPSPIRVEQLDQAQKYFDSSVFMPKLMAALDMVVSTNSFAKKQSDEKVVATVGTFKINEKGMVSLGLDIWGKNSIQRARCERLIKSKASLLQKLAQISFKGPLPGSGEPVEMDPTLVDLASEEIQRFEIGSSVVMFSPAGHDTQNAARAGVPSVMLFCPSHEGAHNPNAYSTSTELEKGVRALAAFTLKLSKR